VDQHPASTIHSPVLATNIQPYVSSCKAEQAFCYQPSKFYHLFYDPVGEYMELHFLNVLKPSRFILPSSLGGNLKNVINLLSQFYCPTTKALKLLVLGSSQGACHPLWSQCYHMKLSRVTGDSHEHRKTGRVQFSTVEIPCAVQFSAISKRGLKDVIVGRRIRFSGGAKIAGAPRSQIATRSTTTLHFGATTCSGIKILERAEI
jgi:hypothetical protein